MYTIGTRYNVADHPDLVAIARQVGGCVEPEAHTLAMDASMLLAKPNTCSWGYGDRFWLGATEHGLLCEVTKRFFWSRSVLDMINSIGPERVGAVIRYNKGDDETNPHLTIYVPSREESVASFASSVDPARDEVEFLE